MSPGPRRPLRNVLRSWGRWRGPSGTVLSANSPRCAFALWAEATAQIQKYGAMIKSPTGFPIQSPYLAIANRQAEIMMRIASEFGFTPASRSRIATPSSHEPSFFDKLEYPDADLGASQDPDGSTPSPLPTDRPGS